MDAMEQGNRRLFRKGIGVVGGQWWRWGAGIACSLLMSQVLASDGQVRFRGKIAVATCEVGVPAASGGAVPVSSCERIRQEVADPMVLMNTPSPHMSWHRLDGSIITGDVETIVSQAADTPTILYLNYP